MKSFTKTDIARRAQNQDFVYTKKYGETVLAIVCDGMGGGFNGAEASEKAANRFARIFDENFNKLPEINTENFSDKIRDLLIKSCSEANEAVAEVSHGMVMGTTLTAAYATEQKSYIVNVGDSRTYTITEKEIAQVTTDHTLVRLWYDTGQITKEEMGNHPQKNMLTRVLGVDEYVKADTFEIEFDIKKGTLLLCSDGLYNAVTEDEIQKTILAYDGKTAIENLVSKALSNGGKDNISVIIINN